MKLFRPRKSVPDPIAEAFAGVDVELDLEKNVRKSERTLIEIQIAGFIFLLMLCAFYVVPRPVPWWWRAFNIFEIVTMAWAVGYSSGTFVMGRSYRRHREKMMAEIKTRYLSPRDLTHINTHHTCPDCEAGSFLHGPHGGLSINVKCDNPECRHEFSITFFQGHAVGGERLQRDDPSLYHGPLWK